MGAGGPTAGGGAYCARTRTRPLHMYTAYHQALHIRSSDAPLAHLVNQRSRQCSRVVRLQRLCAPHAALACLPQHRSTTSAPIFHNHVTALHHRDAV